MQIFFNGRPEGISRDRESHRARVASLDVIASFLLQPGKISDFEYAEGIPRRINRLALEAVKLSARNKVTTVDEGLISVAARVFDGI